MLIKKFIFFAVQASVGKYNFKRVTQLWNSRKEMVMKLFYGFGDRCVFVCV